MPRAIWSGSISFGLVNIPITLYPATKSKTLSFHQLHAADNTPIHYIKTCPVDNKALSSEEIVKGYEFEKGRFVIMENKDFEAAEIKGGHAISILNFVNLNEVDPIYYQKSYFLAPTEAATKAYRLFLQALSNQGKVALAKFILKNKEHLAILRPRNNILLLETMFYEDEVRGLEEFPEAKQEVEVSAEELDLAEGLIAKMTQKFDLSRFKDEHREELLKVINEKIEGKEITVPKLAAPAPVIDIMGALKESIARREREEALPKRKRAS